MNIEAHWFKGVNENMFKQKKNEVFFSVPRYSVPITIVNALYNEPQRRGSLWIVSRSYHINHIISWSNTSCISASIDIQFLRWYPWKHLINKAFVKKEKIAWC